MPGPAAPPVPSDGPGDVRPGTSGGRGDESPAKGGRVGRGPAAGRPRHDGGAPRVETFHLGEVRPMLERFYGAGNRRVAAGESQGGFGALGYAARHPGLFRAVAGFSGHVHPLQHPRAVRAGLDLPRHGPPGPVG
ncbi:alpha/beta hydrolase-fold protein [Streptomyces rubiginosohelvolus]|uniref:alpha/beta hydrolase-fold protein n=1 Tax=Streptomyces rubiginosohelvolus TaxID=67362 RepID=UPI0033BE69F5